MSRMKFRIVVGPNEGRADEPAEARAFDVVLYTRWFAESSFVKPFEDEPLEAILNDGGEYTTETMLTLYPDEAWALISALIESGAGRIESDDAATMTSVEHLRERFSGADEEEG